ncbi:MAG: pyroglutamyl-peptidase I [Alphaproteobacteria bacterium]|nr:pyroglutamyl-peptidase I [Alphaproteobacteria bacterium]
MATRKYGRARIRALVTGFEPFGDDPRNPSVDAIRRLPRRLGTLDLAVRELPTVFDRSRDLLARAVADLAPDIVLCVGLAGGRAELSLERVAVNIDDAPIPDNAGFRPIDRAIVTGGPAAYFTTLPIKAAVAALRAAELPASISNSAGTYVCNHVFYELMHLVAIAEHSLCAGFLHVPYLPSQVSRHPGAPSMTLEEIVRGIQIVLSVTAARIAAGEGAIS